MLEKNKEVVRRFNKEVIENINRAAFEEIMHPDFVNRTAPENANSAESIWNTFAHILRPALSDLKVEIYDQIAENDLVTTRKAIVGTHTGPFLGIQPTGKVLRVDVIDIVRVKDGKYFEHWGMNSLQSLIAELKNG